MNLENTSRYKYYIIRIIVGTLVILGLVWISWKRSTEYIFIEEYASFTSPDGNYRIVVMRMPNSLISMPGQSGDAPGKVLLYQRNGKLLQEAQVDMVQLVDQVHWTANQVQIKWVADWDLPH